ncbi:hypothetical protein [Acinetobacter tandoii]|uniref:hypothetical protein n=1 Tax=Acinetobacter tandoii TaxID=202954 RepID=UPI001D17364D|nr:hypothetical protein [Acinetobacter tandoii]
MFLFSQLAEQNFLRFPWYGASQNSLHTTQNETLTCASAIRVYVSLETLASSEILLIRHSAEQYLDCPCLLLNSTPQQRQVLMVGIFFNLYFSLS